MSCTKAEKRALMSQRKLEKKQKKKPKKETPKKSKLAE
tara:strand:+ start:2223 stop:2336 length:114 start_codon:yes stop_codon:yes gene_type:complete